MGLVYEAYDRERDMRVALKTLRKLDASSLYRFKREFRALSDISHPNIVGLYELVSEGDEWFFTMELLEGQDLIEYLRPDGYEPPSEPVPAVSTDRNQRTLDTRAMARPAAGGAAPAIAARRREVAPPFASLVDEHKLRRGALQLAQALDTLHRADMVHRDLKPANVRVTTTGRVVLMDFGIVAEMSGVDDSDAQTVGTPAFMAPEQALGDPPTPAADWYSFGVVLYLAITGRLPFVGNKQAVMIAKQSREPVATRLLAEGVPADLDALCQALLRRRPEDRPSGEEILTRLGAPAAGPATIETTAGGTTVFVGRDAERAALHDAYLHMLDGSTTTAFVVGPSGMGKSTLVRRFLHELDARRGERDRLIAIRGRCHQRESLPYKAFDGVVDNLAQVLMNLPDDRVAELLPDEIDLLTRLFPTLRRVKGVQAARPFGNLDPHELRARAFAALRELLRRLAAWRPLVLHIDDLQWADADSLELLLDVMQNPAPHCLFIATIRSENLAGPAEAREAVDLAGAVREIAAAHPSVTIELGALTGAEQRQLVQRLLGAGAGDEVVDSPFWSESAGSPLLLGELVRFTQEQGKDLPADAPPTIEDVLFRRIRRLPAPARALVEITAVAGEPVPLWVLAGAVDLSAVDGERASAILRVAHLVRVARHTREPWLTVYHDRVRETVTAKLPGERVRELHQRVALALERWDGATVDALARHWLAAGDRDQATRYLERAARAAADKLAFGRAAELYRAALELGGFEPEAERALRRAMAEALALAGNHFDAADAFSRAADGAPPDDALDLTRRAADNLLRCGQIERGMALVRDVMERLGVRIPVSRRAALLSLAVQRARVAVRGLRFTARPPSAIAARDLGRLDTLYAASTALGMIDHMRGADVQTRHLRLALRYGEERRVCRALAIDAVFRAAAGQRRKAEHVARECELMARRIGDPYLLATAQLGLGAAAFFFARHRAADVAFGEAERVLATECVGADWEIVTARFFRCQAQISLGGYAELAQSAERFIEVAERRRDVYTSNLFRAHPNVFRRLRDDDPARARDELAGALDGWPDDDFYIAHHTHLGASSVLGLYEGRGAETLQRLRDAWRGVRRAGLHHLPWVMAEYWSYVARASVLTGDDRNVRRVARFFDRLELTIGTGVAAGLRGTLDARDGRIDRAERRLLDCVRLCEEAEFHPFAQAYRFRLGQLTGGTDGQRHCDEALAWFASRGCRAPERFVALHAPWPPSKQLPS